MNLELDALRAIGWPFSGPAEERWATALAGHPSARPARVIEQHRSGYLVATGPSQTLTAESPPDWLRRRFPAQDRAAVGDWVLIEAGSGGRSRIVGILPRRTTIKRAAAGEHYQQQLIAANIDTVFVVCGLDADFNPRRIERYLLLIRGVGGEDAPEAVVVLTKADKDGCDATAALAALAGLAAQGIAVVAVNAKALTDVAALDRWLRPGRTAVLVGSSGAGKSTLTNTLLGEERLKTGAVRESDARGRHTTTARSLIPLPSGACLIDTPGMRELKPTGEEDLAEGGFADIEALAAECKFRDCRHAREPGCAVRAAVEANALDAGRVANYLKLRDEVAGAANQLATRLAQKADARVQNKALNKRLDEKYGKH
ncbi:MAG: ribosome small subunit-dependent GTPase A [Lysobacteraceae bacterium]|nr:MAG: ribosome small subunit-dependent GTPase A [Xanthomonadaceae bacterium]